jgi:hypothetical protein
MAKTKYGKYIFKHPIEYGDLGPSISYVGERDFNSDFSLILLPVTKPVLMEEFPHSHDFDMYLTLVGFDPNGLNDLGGEIEIYLGEEQEKHIITTPTSIYMPKGFIHCPLKFTRVDKPILLVHASLAPKYEKAQTYK